MKRLCADDSAGSRVKVGHRQAVITRRPVYGRGALISAPDSSVDESAQSVLKCECLPTMRATALAVGERAVKATEFDGTLQNLS